MELKTKKKHPKMDPLLISWTQPHEVKWICIRFVIKKKELLESVKGFNKKRSRRAVYNLLKKLGYPKPLHK